jgi:NTE family protein
MVVSRAVVLGGGGHTGFGWLWGLITGLQEAGVTLAAADLIVGTSAGAMAAAHLASGARPQELMAEISEPHEPHHPLMTLGQDAFTAQLIRLIKNGRSAAEVRAEFGALALATEGAPENVLRQIAARYLPSREWSRQRVLIPAIDAESGEFTVFDRESGVTLVDAVAASCAVPAVWAPVTIGKRRYMDAIVRSPINADLAAGSERVVVIAPIPEIRGLPGAALAEQLAPVKAEGQVVVITPDEASRAAIGRDQQDLTQRPAAARAGFAQVDSLVEALGEHWHN